MSIVEFLNFIKSILSKEYLLSGQISLEKQKILLYICVFLIIIAILIKFLAYKVIKNKIKQKLFDKIYSLLITISLLGFLFLFGLWQQIRFLAMPLWWLILSLMFFIWGVIIIIYRIRKYSKEQMINDYLIKKQKYLPKKRGKNVK